MKGRRKNLQFRVPFPPPLFGAFSLWIISLSFLKIFLHLGDEKISPWADLPEYVQFVCFPPIFAVLCYIFDLEGSKNAKKQKNSKSNEFQRYINHKPMKRHLTWCAEPNFIMLPHFGHYLSVYQPKWPKMAKNQFCS